MNMHNQMEEAGADVIGAGGATGAEGFAPESGGDAGSGAAADAESGASGAGKKRRRRRRRKPGGGEGASVAQGESAGEDAGASEGDSSEAGAGGEGPAGAAPEQGAEGEPKKRKRRRRRGKGKGEGQGEAKPRVAPVDEADEDEDDSPAEVSPVRAARSDAADIFDLSTKFADLDLGEDVLRGVSSAGFVHPTFIQSKLIGPILAGKDVLGQAKTGSGKTAAFALPLLARCEPGVPFQAIVLVPTRELAMQAAADVARLGKYTKIGCVAVFGGQSIRVQAAHLEKEPEIIVATPGRMMDLVERRILHYRNVRFVVLDEVDRMLDIGFRDDIRRILGDCPKKRQTVFVSATISPEIESLARKYSHDAEKIVTTAGALTVSLVKQYHLTVQPWDKRRLLAHLLTREEPALTVVFCRTKRKVDELTKYLADKGIDARAIHGDMMQSKRDKVMERLRKGKLGVLVASDLASRGLDVEGITHVINYDMPEDPEVYVHRIGRTARAGREGVAWSFVAPDQGKLLTQVELLINAEVPILEYPDFQPGPVPADVLAHQELEQQRSKQASAGANRLKPAPMTGAPQADPSKFPGGVVPSKQPPKKMHGRIRARR